MMRLQQGFAVREMGLRDQVARQQFPLVHVADGSKADMATMGRDVRFTPKSGHQLKGVTTESRPLHRGKLAHRAHASGELRASANALVYR